MCANHPEKEAVAYCRMCGKPLCGVCRLENLGAIYCAEHVPAPPAASVPPVPATSSWESYAGPAYADAPVPSPYTAPAGHGSPWLAVMLGAIPGVGAIYNGQYAKGLIHAVIFGVLVTVVGNAPNSIAPFIGILISVWWFYMVLEAYHTARKRRLGLPVDEFSSLVTFPGHRAAFPVGAVMLIGAGMLLLADSIGLIPLNQVIRYWPVALILLGVYMLYSRLDRRPAEPLTPQEFTDERR